MPELSIIDSLREMPDAEERLACLADGELSALEYDWASWARPNQVSPNWDWTVWLILAGRGFGKTRCGAERVRQWVKDGHQAPNLIAATADDLRDTMVEGESGILAVCPKSERPIYYSSRRCLDWPNGAKSLLFTAQEPDRLRGKQSTAIWADELAAWQYAEESWDQAMFGLRLGSRPQAVVTTTPRPTKIIKELMSLATTHVTRATTYDNRSNLASAFYSAIIKKYEGTRLGRQELNAEVLDDNPGALFKLSDIDAGRVSRLPPLTRIVVAMDPATTSNEDSDEWGIVAVGQDGRDPAHYYVLVDDSGIYTPDEAAKVAVRLYHRLMADRMIGEANNGGDMIESLIRHQDANVSYKKVTASRGKVIRAEPVSALYEQHRVHHHGVLAKLEDQATGWNPKADEDSPDRMDAMVWGITELAQGTDGWAGYVKGQAVANSAAGITAPLPETRILVDGRSKDICECGSTFWVRIVDKEECYKCHSLRPR